MLIGRIFALVFIVASAVAVGSAAAEGVFTDHQAGKSWYYDKNGTRVGEVTCVGGFWQLVDKRSVYPCQLVDKDGKMADGGVITAGPEILWKK